MHTTFSFFLIISFRETNGKYAKVNESLENCKFYKWKRFCKKEKDSQFIHKPHLPT